MLGCYKNFPQNVHAVASFDYQESKKDVQKAILCAIQQLNHEICDLTAITPYLTQKCEVGFEFGVANGFDFYFLDQKELNHFMKFVVENEVKTLDFFLVVRYHLVRENNKRVPLRFDYHVLRFAFHVNGLEIRIRHERGSQRVTSEELITFVNEKINDILSRRQLTPLLSRAFKRSGIT